MKKIHAFDIEWDLDNEDVYIPTDVYVELEDDEDPAEDLANVLSDMFGFLVISCNYEEVEQND